MKGFAYGLLAALIFGGICYLLNQYVLRIQIPDFLVGWWSAMAYDMGKSFAEEE